MTFRASKARQSWVAITIFRVKPVSSCLSNLRVMEGLVSSRGGRPRERRRKQQIKKAVGVSLGGEVQFL
jgi:hypothetical protein